MSCQFKERAISMACQFKERAVSIACQFKERAICKNNDFLMGIKLSATYVQRNAVEIDCK